MDRAATSYTATITLRPAIGVEEDDVIDRFMEALTDYHPAVSPAPESPGAWAVTTTYPAESLGQAVTTARALTSPLGALEGLEVITTEAWDRRSGLPADDVELVGVTEAAGRLGLTPQAVRDRITAGTLPGKKIGRSWAVPATALPD